MSKSKNQQTAYDKIGELTEHFASQIDILKKKQNETETRIQFINPLFDALGWDIDNTRLKLPNSYRDVIHEDKIKVDDKTKVGVQTKTKAPDYCFTNYGKRTFFLEAKKPSVSIKTDIEPSYQIRRYGWSAKLPISILTDFEEFAIYDCTRQPKVDDSAATARLKYLTFDQYLTQFDWLWDTFSKEQVVKGSLDQYAKADKKGTQSVDYAFLQSLDEWRNLLATNIAIRNKHLNEDDINYIVQMNINRIVFLRNCEDRGAEAYGDLRDCLKSGKYEGAYFKNMYRLFGDADRKYNSGLFDFTKDTMSKTVSIDNKVISTIVSELYYPKSPYEFSVIGAEILGTAYERFLGKVIRLTAGHQAKVEEKPEVRKAGGVFYTPQYIVEYIVKNTVGKLIEGKTPDEVAHIKICDPACGSGSFLLGAYQFLLKYYTDYYTKNYKKSRNAKDSPLTPEGRLTTHVKKEILLNNIFGVDLDAQAVEVTKLSLLLQCMEGETAASMQTTMTFERVLPTLDNNIKSGNSLIDFDFYEGKLDFGEDKKIKPFNWKQAYPSVFKQGGFDAVIGNPPYGAELTVEEQKYFLKKYPIGNTDTAALFMIFSKDFLMKNKGFNSFIIPKAFTYASNWNKTRLKLIDDLNDIVDCSKVWQEVKLEMSIYNSQKNSKTNKYTSSIRNDMEIVSVGNIDKTLANQFGFLLNGVSNSDISIGLKIKKTSVSLNKIVTNQRGGMLQKDISDEGELIVLGGKQVQRFFISNEAKGKIELESINDSKAHIKPNSVLVQNIVAHIMNPTPRIKIIATIPKEETVSKFVILDTINQLSNKSDFSNKLILGVLNSNLICWYAYRFIFANAIRTMHFDSGTTDNIPFPNLDLKKKTDKTQHDEIVKNVELLLQLNAEQQTETEGKKREQAQGRIAYAEQRINEIVYALYGLTEEEIAIVEGA